jgi:exonuclease III
VGDYNTTLSPVTKSSKQEILELNVTINKMDLTDVYRVFHPTKAQYTIFSAAHGMVSKIDHTLGQKSSLSKYKKI